MTLDDPDDYEDGWHEPDEDEPDDNWHWYDDDPRPPKEEPDCYVCNDGGGRCCQPTRLDILRWRVRFRLRLVLNKLSRRRQVLVDDPWAPAAPSAPPPSPGGFVSEPPF